MIGLKVNDDKKQVRKSTRILSMSSTIDSFLWPNKYMLTFLGYWPLKPDASIAVKLFTYFRIVFSILAIWFLFIPEILMIIVNWGDIFVLTGVGCVTTTLAQLTFKLLYVIAHRRSFYRIYYTIQELWKFTKQKDERKGLENLANQAKRCSVAFFFTCFCNNISFSATSIVVWMEYNANENKSLFPRRLPFDVWCGFDLEKTPNFEIVFGCQQIAAIFCCVGIVGLDSTMMTLILHVCGHFRVIRARLRTIGSKMTEEIEPLKPERYFTGSRIAISQCIEHHRRLISFAEEVRNLLSPVIFVQLLTSGLEICLSGYAVIVNGGSAVDFFKFLGYFLSIFAQLVIWCWPGQLLIQDSAAIGDIVCYELPWYKVPAPQQRELILIIARAQKQCQITALGFQVMSLRKLTEVFNTAGSYMALLKSVYENPVDQAK